ncbi:hypothetical protein HYX11_01435 [Candidatus Woesearchaeota archaeon]|nr:hypothetical protein [Candidatus Woesearchaeota archaeon]
MNKTNYLLRTLALSAMVGLANCGGRRAHVDSERSVQSSPANVTYLSEDQQCRIKNEEMKKQMQLVMNEKDSALKEKTELEAKIRTEEQAACEKRIASWTPPKPVEDKFLPDIDKPVHPFLKALAEGKYSSLTNLNDEKEFSSPDVVINKSLFSLEFSEHCPKEKQCVQSLSFNYYRGNGSYELEYSLEKMVINKDTQGESEGRKIWTVVYEGKGQVLNYEELTKIISEYIESKDVKQDGEQRVMNLNPKQVSAEYKSIFTTQV